MGPAGCGDDGDEGGPVGQPATIRVHDTAGLPTAFLEYGIAKGYFKKRKLTLEVKSRRAGAGVVRDVTSGRAEIGGSSLVSVLLAEGRDPELKIVAPGTFVQFNRRRDFAAILVAGDSDVRAPSDLEGKALAIDTQENEVTAKESLRKKGVAVSKIEFAEVDPADMTAAVEQGTVDAAFAIEPVVTQAVTAGYRIVDRPYVGTRPGLQTGCYFATEKYLKRNRDVVRRFREALFETGSAIRNKPAKFRAFLPKASEIPRATAQRLVLPEWKPLSDQSSIDLTAELMRRHGVARRELDTSEATDEP